MMNPLVRYFWLPCFMWLLCGGVNAQDLVYLESKVDKAQTQQERLEAMKALVDSSISVDLARTAIYVPRMLDMAKRANSAYHMGFAEEKQGTLFYKGAKLDMARVRYKRAYDHYWQAGSKEAALLVYTRVGIMYSLEGKFAEAARIYDQVRQSDSKTDKVNAFLYNQLGTLHHYQNSLDSAGYYYDKAAAAYAALHDTVAQLRAMHNHAVLLIDIDQRTQAKTLAFQIKELQERIGAWEGLNFTHGMLMGITMAEGDYEKALFYGEKQLNYAKNVKDTVKLIDALSNIGKVVLERGEPAASIPYIQEALAMAQKSNYFEEQQLGLINLGEAYLKMGRINEAETNFKACFDLSEKTGDSRYAPLATYYLGKLYHQTGRLKEAKIWLQKSVERECENIPLPDVVLLYGTLADIHLTENNPASAIKMAEKGYKLATEIGGVTEWLVNLTNTLYKAHKTQGNYQAALLYHEQYKQLSDTLYNVEKVKTEAQQLKDFQFKQEKEALAAAQQVREAQLTAQARLNALIAGFVGLLALVSLAFFMNLRKQQARIRAQNDELSRLNATKDRIFAIIGHDMRKPALAFRGMTQKIDYLLQKQDYARLNALGSQLEETAYSLTTVTDNLLNWALLQKNIAGYHPQPVVLLQVAQELTAIFATAAHHKNITLSILPDTPPEQELYADPLMLRTILRNLIDNAIKYTPEYGAVTVTATAEGEWVNISVQDTGIGIPEAEHKDLFLLQSDKSRSGTAGEKGTGLGLHLAHELTKINKGILALNTQIAQGTRFDLSLPVTQLQ